MKTFVCLFALVAVSRACDDGLMKDIYGNTCPATGTGCSKDATDSQTCYSPSALGCPELKSCMPSTDPATGKAVGCPVLCASNELLCSDPSKTPDSDYCIPSQYQSMAPGNAWCMASCDMPCADDQQQCIDYDPSGCQTTTCMPADTPCPKMTFDSNGCPVDGSDPGCWCDPLTQNVCQDPYAADPAKAFCVDKAKGNGWAMAPSDCAADETPCPGSIGPDNCPMAGFCAKEASDCMTDWNGCPIMEPAKCADTEVSCPQTGPDGCSTETCIDAKDTCKSDFEWNGCPVVEPVDCDVGTTNCPRGNDIDGCPQADTCVATDDRSLCGDVCDPPCDEMTEDMCSFVQNGCPAKQCVTKGTPCDMVGL